MMVLELVVWSNHLVGPLLPPPQGSERYFPVGVSVRLEFPYEGRARQRLLREGWPEGGALFGGRLLNGLVASSLGRAYLTLIGPSLHNRGFWGYPLPLPPSERDVQPKM